jgi:8-oxo-dGTP diphosphatase
MTLAAYAGTKQVTVTEYTVGFLFCRALNMVALIRKNKPEWQNGLLNGIGGKVEAEETPYQCMVREFLEEAVDPKEQDKCVFNWERFCSIQGKCEARCPGDDGIFRVHFYRAFTDYTTLRMRLKANTSEGLVIDNVLNITAQNAIPNLPWLLRMALDIDLDAAEGFDIKESYLEP